MGRWGLRLGVLVALGVSLEVWQGQVLVGRVVVVALCGRGHACGLPQGSLGGYGSVLLQHRHWHRHICVWWGRIGWW